MSLFNGNDLTGWGFRDQKTLEKKQAFDGKTASSDGRYVAKNGRLIVTTPPEGRKITQLWTTREFPKDFVAQARVPRHAQRRQRRLHSQARSSSAATTWWPARTRT